MNFVHFPIRGFQFGSPAAFPHPRISLTHTSPRCGDLHSCRLVYIRGSLPIRGASAAPRCRAFSALLLLAIALTVGICRPAVAQDARRVAALADLVTMRDAEILVQVDTGYYTSLENLDDLPGLNTIEPRDGIEDQGGAWMLDPATGRWRAARMPLDHSPWIWRGPYVNYQNRAGDDGEGYDPGTPLDPWGQPYLLYSPVGLARPTIPGVTLEYHADRFDRWAIVSLANDGIVSDDDIGVEFGSGPTALVISSLRLSQTGATRSTGLTGVTAEATPTPASGQTWIVSVKGYNFGSTQQTSSVLVDGVPIDTPSTTWSSVAVDQPLPVDLEPGIHTVALRVGAVESNALSFTLVAPLTAVRSGAWALYE